MLRLRVGAHVVDVGALRVASNPDAPRLSSKAVAVLIELVRNAGDTVTRDRFLDVVWKDRVTTLENSPIGDNYDFSGYDIHGFIVLPELMFTPREDSREIIHFGQAELFFTKVESFGQLAATLEMASWPPEPPALRALRLSEQ